MARLSRACTPLRVGILNNAISHATVSAIVGGSGLTDSCVRHREDKDGNEKIKGLPLGATMPARPRQFIDVCPANPKSLSPPEEGRR
jgi:hypothetical protein